MDNSIVAYSPAFKQRDNTFASAEEDLGNKNENIAKVMSLETLHKLIEFSLMSLLNAAVRGMAATSNDEEQYCEGHGGNVKWRRAVPRSFTSYFVYRWPSRG